MGYKLINRMTGLEMRVDGDERLGPKPLLIICSIDLRTDFWRVDLRKGACERFVSFYQRLIEIEYIHGVPLQLSPERYLA